MSCRGDIIERANLLARAVELCTSVAAVLHELGPRSCSVPSSGVGSGYGGYREVCQLEDKLHCCIQTVLEYRNDVLAPVSRLPEEILRTIFLSPSQSNGPGRDFPLLVSKVCRRWRVVALNTSNLWTSVRLIPPPHMAADESEPWHPWYLSTRKAKLANVDAEFFARSGSSLLSVDLTVQSRIECAPLLSFFLTSFQGRVRDLSLLVSADKDSSIHQATACLTLCKPILQRLKLQILNDENRAATRSLVDKFFTMDIPHLFEVVLENVPLPTVHKSSYVALQACKCLDLIISQERCAQTDGLATLLRSCPQLKILQIKMYLFNMRQGPGPWRFRDENRVHMEKLESYSVFGSPSSFPFLCLTAPHLRCLALNVLRNPEHVAAFTQEFSELAASLEAFLLTSSAEVEGLEVQNFHFTYLPRILERTPQVRRLNIAFDGYLNAPSSIHDYSNALLSMGPSVVDRRRPRPLCPNLNILEYGANAMPVHLRELLQFARMRNFHNMRIRRVKLADWPDQHFQHADTTLAMAPSPEEAYELERLLAGEVDELVVGKWTLDKETGFWTE